MDQWFIDRLIEKVLRPQAVPEAEIDEFRHKYVEYKAADGSIKWQITSSADRGDYCPLTAFVSKVSGVATNAGNVSEPTICTTDFPSVTTLPRNELFIQMYTDEIYQDEEFNVSMLDKIENMFKDFDVLIEDNGNRHVLYEYRGQLSNSEKRKGFRNRLVATIQRITTTDGTVSYYAGVPVLM